MKRSESGMIVNPITLSPTDRISEALELMQKYRISGVPITEDGDTEGKLVGILTNRDLRFDASLDRPIGDVMTRDNLITVPVGTTLQEARAILHTHRVEKLLVVDQDFRLKGAHHRQGHPEDDHLPNRVQGCAGPAPGWCRGSGSPRTPWSGPRRWSPPAPTCSSSIRPMDIRRGS